MKLEDAMKEALNLGATHMAESHFPAPHNGIFSYHFFKDDNNEVGIYFPAVWGCDDGLQPFNPPRKWDKMFMEALFNYRAIPE